MSTLIGYARVSTQDQSLEHQIEALNEVGCTKVFSGKHRGATKTNEDALAQLTDYVRDGDTVVVTKLDRLGRSLRQVLQTIETLRSKGASLKTLEQPVDTSKDDAFSNAMLQLLGVFAEMERTFIVERTQAGRKASGKLGGRPPKLDDVAKKSVQAKFAAGASKNALSQEFGVSRLTIKRIVEA
jgi:DNA invertase Pin-like site-specific DNA recombinase